MKRVGALHWALLLAPMLCVACGDSGPPFDPAMHGIETRPSAPEGMVWIPFGVMRMGCADGAEDERPVHDVQVAGFFLDRTEVTNAQFARFVEDTGYVTFAERVPTPDEVPGAAPEDLVPGGLVFHPPENDVGLDDWSAWWRFVPGADWRHPEGPQSNIDTRADHPVVQVTWLDAVEYARWAKRRLPTEAEWEFAARGGFSQKPFASGDELTPGGKWSANIWQGRFPRENSAADGFVGTAPVGSFAPNRYGLFDMAGNVWEWCSDYYAPDTYARAGEFSIDPRGPDSGTERVERGGSYLCSDVYCTGYRPSARMHADEHTSLAHTGFRCALSR